MNITMINFLSDPTTGAIRDAFGEKAGQILGTHWVNDDDRKVSKVSTHVGETEMEVEVETIETQDANFHLTVTTKDKMGEILSGTIGYVKADEMDKIVSKAHDTAWVVALMRGLLKDHKYDVLPTNSNTFLVYDQDLQNSAEVHAQPHKGIIDVTSENRKFAQKVALTGALRGKVILDREHGATVRHVLYS